MASRICEQPFVRLLIVTLAYTASAWSAPSADQLTSVSTISVRPTELFDPYFYPVVLEAKKESEIYAEINGVVKEIRVKIGQGVRADEVVMVLQQTRPDFAYAPFQVRSPVGGKVAAIPKKVGSRVQQGDLLIHIVNHDDLTMKFEIPESEMTVLTSGITGEIQFRVVDQTLPVMISGMSPLVSPLTGTSSGELAWNEKAFTDAAAAKIRNRLFPGMVGRVNFKVNVRTGFKVPKDAVSLEQQVYFVRVVASDVIARKNVTLGREFGSDIEVTSGLVENDAVVTSHGRYLKIGDRVKVESKGEH